LTEWIGCDKCGGAVQAMWLARSVNGELYFCGHHKNAYQQTIDQWAYEVIELNKTEDVPQLEMADE
jgi:hypothetical protein